MVNRWYRYHILVYNNITFFWIGIAIAFLGIGSFALEYNISEFIDATNMWKSMHVTLRAVMLQSEYIAPSDCRRAFVSGFDGSAG